MVMSARDQEMRPFAAPHVRTAGLRFPKWTRFSYPPRRTNWSARDSARRVRRREVVSLTHNNDCFLWSLPDSGAVNLGTAGVLVCPWMANGWTPKPNVEADA